VTFRCSLNQIIDFQVSKTTSNYHNVNCFSGHRPNRPTGAITGT
jgi:hypothetical protein